MSSKLEKLKKDLDEAIKKPEVSIEELTKISNDIDIEIQNSYIKNPISSEEKYQCYTNRTDKEYIIQQIRNEITSRYYNITSLEIDILSKNIYDYCCLMVNKVPKQDIISYILEKNNKIYDSLTEDQINSMKVDSNLKYFKWLIEKYNIILQSNKES